MNAPLPLIRNLRDLPRGLTGTAWLAGLVAVLIAYTGPLVLVFQAAQQANIDHAYVASWIWALTVGSGLTTLPLCLWYRQPIVVAWSIAGSALLVSSLAHYTLPEAVGAYLLAGLATVLLGWSGLFGRMLMLVPKTIVLGMLVGVLLRFGVGLFTALAEQPFMVGMMVVAFLALQRWSFRAPTIGALVVGLLVAALSHDLRIQAISLEVAVPRLVWPAWKLDVLLGLGVPLFVLAIASQNAPGIAVLRSAGYDAPVDAPLMATGLASLLTAPFAGHGLNLAALMGAICTSPEAHPDPDLRYGAGVAAGIWFILFGSFGATAAALFAALPKALVAAVAGLAMAPALRSALVGAMDNPDEREGALFALLLGASDITLFGIGAPFWALVVGVVTSRILRQAQPT